MKLLATVAAATQATDTLSNRRGLDRSVMVATALWARNALASAQFRCLSRICFQVSFGFDGTDRWLSTSEQPSMEAIAQQL